LTQRRSRTEGQWAPQAGSTTPSLDVHGLMHSMPPPASLQNCCHQSTHDAQNARSAHGATACSKTRRCSTTRCGICMSGEDMMVVVGVGDLQFPRPAGQRMPTVGSICKLAAQDKGLTCATFPSAVTCIKRRVPRAFGARRPSAWLTSSLPPTHARGRLPQSTRRYQHCCPG
jgi:hypothetical protein